MKLSDMSFKNNGYSWLALVLVFYAVLGFAYYCYVFTPQLAAKEKANNELLQEKKKVMAVENFALAHPDIPGYLASLDKELVRVEKLLPDNPNMGETIALLEDTAKNTGVVFGAFKTDKKVYNNRGWTETLVTFKVGGYYPDLLEFTRRLDNAPRLMVVRSVAFDHKVLVNTGFFGRADVQAAMEKEFGNDTGLLRTILIERGLLSKPTLVVMQVQMTIATRGQLPDAEKPSAQQKPAS